MTVLGIKKVNLAAVKLPRFLMKRNTPVVRQKNASTSMTTCGAGSWMFADS